MKFCRLHGVVVVAVSLGGCPGCPDAQDSPGVRDASRDVHGDVSRPTKTARRRRRRGVRATGSASAARNTQSPDDPTIEEPMEPEPAARPRITETGPMLPESMGSAPEVAYDMSAAGEGPIGISEGQVTRGMHPLMQRLGTCAAATTDDQGHGPRGRVNVQMRIRSDGRPVAARVYGGGGPAEFVTCVRRVVASARFESFRGPDAIVRWGFDVD